jgi:hypothetical protein
LNWIDQLTPTILPPFKLEYRWHSVLLSIIPEFEQGCGLGGLQFRWVLDLDPVREVPAGYEVALAIHDGSPGNHTLCISTAKSFLGIRI